MDEEGFYSPADRRKKKRPERNKEKIELNERKLILKWKAFLAHIYFSERPFIRNDPVFVA